MFPDFFAPDTSTFPSLTSAASDPSPSGPSTSSHVDAGGPSDQLFVSLAPPSDPSSLGKPRRTQVSNSRKKGKGTRAVDECDAFCAQCHKFIAKLLLRGSQEELDVSYDLYHRCSTCAPLGHGSSTRKRANEPDDTASPTICDVCNRIQGFGGFNAKDSRTILAFSVEVVCASCSNKYRRCTNCGGGSARGGIGKWRCKEIFEDDRKTCRLSHERLGGRDMELAVWDILTELPGRQDLPQVIGAIESLWHDHVIARMGVPEVLEYQSVRTYEEIKAKILDLHFPGRSLFTNQAPVPGRRLLLALTWAKMRARRDKSKPLWAQSRPQDKSIHEWVAYNTRRSNVLYPANSLLCGVWIAEWNIADRTLLMGTVCMFDYLDVEDRSAYSFEEFMQRILCEIKEHNASHPEDPWHPPEHLWAAIKSNPYSLRMRLVETLERRLGFMPVQEYLTRYPGVKRELFTADSALLAKAINDRVSVDNKDMTIIVKYVGVSTLEGLERKKAVRLAKPHKAEAKYD
ncbi:hypothetical protein DENSPDRAFT_769462 [Dentipellis sp. KUC8613]|nr:hypothetical protein DENSPDRAFT_769462 [Dentipellis sp. KUC8613]